MKKILGIIKNIFHKLDERVLLHGERVAYFTYLILKEENKYSQDEIKDAVVLALLHDIGALRTDEIDNLISFDSNDTMNHCIYGYLFLKYFSPIKKKSEIILYHHTKEDRLSQYLSGYEKDICGLIHLTDRIDVWNMAQNKQMFNNDLKHYNEKYYDLFMKLNKNNLIIDSLKNDMFRKKIDEIDSLFKSYEVKKYLEMLVYAIDFRSYQTVTHSLLVAMIAKELGIRLNLSHKMLIDLQYSALLHDVGKVAVPSNILEKNGKLTNEEMEIMKKHIIYSKEIIEPFINSNILFPAIRHHERCDGAGYPDRLQKNELSTNDNIIIIADLVSALTMKRSYKESFSKEKTLAILKELVQNNKIDDTVFNTLLNNYDEILSTVNKKISLQERKFLNINEEYSKICNSL